MDEADGRLGPQAQQFGPADVHADAPAKSLCRILAKTHPSHFRDRTRARFTAACTRSHIPSHCQGELP